MCLSEIPPVLLAWYETNRRDLPWRRDREAYHVWLSEIMLQQTRVEAVKSYYTRFLQQLPTIADLAACEEDRLYKLWEGLGYYTRVRNLQKAAQVICREYGGQFPRDYAQVRALPGIGDYTAGAICSICFEQKTPAVDGNVLRVVSRLLASRASISSAQTKREMTRQLAQIYPEGRCGDFTQALMELGATVCGPGGAPQCGICPLHTQCASRPSELWREIPVKDAKKARKVEERTVFLLQCEGKVAICKRPAAGLLARMWEFPNVQGRLQAQQALEQAAAWGVHPTALERETQKVHVFTHITWNMTGYYLRCSAQAAPFQWADAARLEQEISLPTAFRQFWTPQEAKEAR